MEINHSSRFWFPYLCQITLGLDREFLISTKKVCSIHSQWLKMAFLYQLIVNILWSLNFLCTWKILRILNYFNKYWDLFPNFQSDFQTQCSRLTHKDDGTLNSQRMEFCGFYFTATYTFVLMEKIAEYLNEVCMLVLLCIIFYFSWVKSARICFVLNCCLQRWVLFLNILICKISRGQKEDLRKSRKIEHHPSRYACFFFPSTMMIIYYKMMAKIMRNYAMLENT